MITFKEFKKSVEHLNSYKVELTSQSEVSGFWSAKVESKDNIFTRVFMKYLYENDIVFKPHEGWIEIY